MDNEIVDQENISAKIPPENKNTNTTDTIGIDSPSKPSLGLQVVRKDSPEIVNADNVYDWFKQVTKGKKKFLVTDEALDLINKSITEPEFDGFRFIDTMITYQSALAQDRVSLEDYVNAIRFCSYLEVSNGNATEAYIKAFRHRPFVSERMNIDKSSDDFKNITSAATRYRKNPLVINILTQAEVPLYLMFQGYRYQAINRLVTEMNEAKLPKDRITAADKLLTHLTPPENIKVELDVGIKKDNIVDQYETMIANMVSKQKELLQAGGDITEIANSKQTFIDAEVVANG